MQFLTPSIKDSCWRVPKKDLDCVRVWVKIAARNRYLRESSNGTFFGGEVVNNRTCGIGKRTLRTHNLANKGVNGAILRFPGLLDKHGHYPTAFWDVNCELGGIKDFEINTLLATDNFAVADFAVKENFYCATFFVVVIRSEEIFSGDGHLHAFPTDIWFNTMNN